MRLNFEGKSIIKIIFLLLIATNLILFTLLPQCSLGTEGKRTWFQEIMFRFNYLHKGSGYWSYYTVKNGVVNIEIYETNEKGDTLSKVSAPKEIINPHFLIYRGHSELRVLNIAISILQQYPKSYQWICSHYDFKPNRRYYISISPVTHKDTFKYFSIIPKSNNELFHNNIPVENGSLNITSFICKN